MLASGRPRDYLGRVLWSHSWSIAWAAPQAGEKGTDSTSKLCKHFQGFWWSRFVIGLEKHPSCHYHYKWRPSGYSRCQMSWWVQMTLTGIERRLNPWTLGVCMTIGRTRGVHIMNSTPSAFHPIPQSLSYSPGEDTSCVMHVHGLPVRYVNRNKGKTRNRSFQGFAERDIWTTFENLGMTRMGIKSWRICA